MSPSTVNVQDIALVVAAKNHNSTILNPDFLKCSGIIPSDWELARPPLYTQQFTQIIFRSGVSIIAQANQIMFVETMNGKMLQDIEVPRIARQYIQLLPNADYQALGINFRGFVPFNQDASAARQYLMQTLLAPGSWHEYGEEPAKATIHFLYTLKQRRLSLSVNEASLQLPEGETTPIVLFSGNFEYDMSSAEGDRISHLRQVLEDWQTDLEAYQELINTRFLAPMPGWSLSVPDVLSIGA